MDSQLDALVIIFTEFYYWVTLPLMFLIHVGFCLYEVGVSRRKNHMHTLMKNAGVIPFITITFYLFGWWIYFGFANGPGITGGWIAAPWAQPWNELMGAHLGGQPVDPNLTTADTVVWSRLNGVFWAAFLLFSWTTASIVSGALIERVRTSAFWLIAVVLGSVTWLIDAAWGWSPAGWMVQLLGYHDAFASGVVHAIAGGTVLGVLINLGPRIGRFRADGTPRVFPLHNPWLVMIGLFMIYAGFWGFYAACNVPIFDIDSSDGTFFSATTIYFTPTTLSAITFNFLMSLSGGFFMGYFVSKGDPFWSFSGGLAGAITASAGNDLYHPMQAFLIGCFGVFCVYHLHNWVERRFKLDDAVGAVAVHGYGGFIGTIIAGFVLWGYPSSPNIDYPAVNPLGNFIGAIIMFVVLGFIPGYGVSYLLKKMNLLRIPEEVELAGLDYLPDVEAEEQARELVGAELAYVNGSASKGTEQAKEALA